jgi:hypothetical protein
MTNDVLTIEVAKLPQAPSITEDINGKRWVVLTAYQHLGENYIQGVPIDYAETYKIVEKKTL